MSPTGNDALIDGYFRCGRGLQKKRGLRPGIIVDDAVAAAADYRDKHHAEAELFVAVFVKRADGIVCRYSAALAPGHRRPAWELSG